MLRSALAFSLCLYWPPACAPRVATAQTSAAVMERALELLRAGRGAEAEVLFRQIVELEPEHGPARLQLGMLAFERGELAEAEAHLALAAAAGTQRPHVAWHLLGRVQLLAGRPAEARVSFASSIARAPRFVPALIGRARAALAEGHAGDAVADLEQALLLEPENAEAGLQLGENWLLAEQEQRARDTLQAVIAGGSMSGGDPAQRSRLEARLLLLALAAPGEDQALRAALGPSLHLPGGLVAMALSRLRARDPGGALAPLRMALETDPEDPTAWRLLEQAGVAGDTVVWPAPVPGLACRLGEAQRRLESGDASGALAIAAELLEQRAFNAPANLLAIQAAEAEGDLWQALAGYRRLLGWVPGVPTLEARAAQVARRMGALELAKCLASRALFTLPEDGSLHHLLGAVQLDAGAWDAAVASLQLAAELGVEEAALFAALGRAELERGEVSGAIAAYRRALELDPNSIATVPLFALTSLGAADSQALRGFLGVYLGAHVSDANALYALGLLELRSDELEPARISFQALAALAPEDSRAPYNLALVQNRLGDGESARASLERFRTLKAAEDEEWERVNQVHFARLRARDAEARGEGDGALRGYEEVATTPFSTVEDSLAAGRLSLELGVPRKAYAWFERALAAAPYRREALAGLASAAAALGRDDVARVAREQVDLLSWPCGS